MTLVSVVTPSYNQAEFLEHTIQSMLRQELDDPTLDGQSTSSLHKLEYIVVDGASKDNSIDILKRYDDSLAWWVSEPDKGQAEAINKGFQRARGEIVAWLNSDDLYLPGAVQHALTVLEANPEIGMVFGDAITIDQHGRPLNLLTFGNWGLCELMTFRIICQPAVFMRRSVLEKAGFLDPSYHLMLDHHLWLRMARLAPVQHIHLPLAAARHHAGAKNVRQAAAFGEEIFAIVEWLQNQPDLADMVQINHRKILGGAYRLYARYLLDGDQPGAALDAYARAFWYSPAYALKHSHRVAFALLSWISGNRFSTRERYSWAVKSTSKEKKTDIKNILSADPRLREWPGLSL